MRKFYETKPVLFAILWIVVYVVLIAPLRGRFGDGSLQMLLGLVAISTGLLLFVRTAKLKGALGLDRWLRNGKKLLWLLPMWVLATGNLWGGLGLKYTGVNAIMATLSFLLIGFVEETIFRGFLFNGMRRTGRLPVAIIVSAVTFGMGHIVNLLTGQATVDTLLQMVFAVAWGFLLTYAYYKGGSLLPCILIHGIIDAASVFSRDSVAGDTVFMVATIVVSAVTFGMGHIVNLLTGQATADTLLQMVFAVAWGFLLTYAYYKGGSLLPCILIHGIIDAASAFSRDSAYGDVIFMIATIVVALVYCAFMAKQPSRLGPTAQVCAEERK